MAAGEAVEAKEGDQNVDEDTGSNASEVCLYFFKSLIVEFRLLGFISVLGTNPSYCTQF